MLSWSNRRDDEPGDHPYIVAAVSVDPGNPTGVSLARVPLQPVPYAPPDGKQDDYVIEPTALFKPWLPYTDWDNVEITVEYYD